jgi:hypothetical protein
MRFTSLFTPPHCSYREMLFPWVAIMIDSTAQRSSLSSSYSVYLPTLLSFLPPPHRGDLQMIINSIYKKNNCPLESTVATPSSLSPINSDIFRAAISFSSKVFQALETDPPSSSSLRCLITPTCRP